MVKEWHYLLNGKEHGPVDFAELNQLLAFGKLQPSDMIWKVGMPQWVPARLAEDVFPQQIVTADMPVKEQKERTPVAQSQENCGPNGSQGKLARGIIWLGVTIWCFLPFLWLILTAITNRPAGSSTRYDDGSGGNTSLGAVVGFGGGGILFLALFYGIWCAVGVVCGHGLERALTVAEELHKHQLLFFRQRKDKSTQKR
jgi:hypothetical protein